MNRTSGGASLRVPNFPSHFRDSRARPSDWFMVSMRGKQPWRLPLNLTSRTADGPHPQQPRLFEHLRIGRSRFVRRLGCDRGPVAVRSLTWLRVRAHAPSE